MSARNAGDTLARELLHEARELMSGDASAQDRLTAAEERLDEPLRVALAGKIKAGKSTLLNAFLGERVAPTDTGECTRVVTWYRHGTVPRVTVVPRSGKPRPQPVRRVDGRLVLTTGGLASRTSSGSTSTGRRPLSRTWPSSTPRAWPRCRRS